MGSKSKELTVWSRGHRQPVRMRYGDEELLLDPYTILQEASHYRAEVLSGNVAETRKESSVKYSKSFSLRELRRRFWHFRNRSKQALRGRFDKYRESEIPASPTQPLETSSVIYRSDARELFDPSLQRSRLEQEIRDLRGKLDSKTATELEMFRLLQRLYRAGHLTSAVSFIHDHEATLRGNEIPDPHLVDKILSENDLLHHLPEIPERGDGPIVVPENGRILYCAASTIHYHSNGYATRTAGLVGGLNEIGADIVVAARPGYPWDVRAHKAPQKSIFHIKQADGVEYAYSYGPSLKSQSLTQYIEMAVDSYLRLIEKYRPEHIHAASNHVTALPALIAARIAGLTFTYEVRGFWEYALHDTLDQPNERRLLATKLEDLVLRNADHIFILSPEMKSELESRGYSSDSITILPNGVDTNVFQPLPKVGDLVRKHKLDDGKINIGYAGSMVAYEGLDILTDALLQLAQERSDFRFVLIGDGPVLPGIEEKLREASTELDVQILGRMAPSLIPNLISSLDLTVTARKSTEVTKLVSPLKPLESMAAGVPFIAADLPVLRGLVNESQGGVLFESMNSESLANRIREFLDEPTRLKSLGRIGRQWTLTNRRWPDLAGQLFHKIEGITPISPAEGKLLSTITIGLIADEFTTSSFEGTANVLILDRHKWHQQLDAKPVDMIFVESAWNGNGGQWYRGIGHYTYEESNDLESLLQYCKSNRIPTVFWNKEDPVHFERFKRNAMLFDLVLTTDNRSIPRYQELQEVPHQKFGSLPFFATPKIHHPLRKGKHGEAQVIYAGSYYGDRYPERSKSLLELLEAAKHFNLNIYDRQLDHPDSPYKFPADLEPYVQGGLSYDEMLEAYRKFPIHLNVNSVNQSETMFSRRVVEIGMTGGMVMSSPSSAMSMLFSGMVPQAQSEEQARELLSLAVASPELRNLHGWNLRRLIRRSHSVYTRLIAIMRRVGIHVKGLSAPKIGVVVEADTSAIQWQSLLNQTLAPRLLFLSKGEISEKLRSTFRMSGIDIITSPDTLSNIDYLLYWDGDFIDPETLEDAVFLAEDLGASDIYIDPTRPTDIHEPLASAQTRSLSEGSRITYVHPRGDRDLKITMRRGMVDTAYVGGLQIPEGHVPKSTKLDILVERLRGKRILVAGHDLKFLHPIIEKITSLGIEVAIDQWQSHNSHDEERSRDLLADADVIFCEWGLGNAQWYSRNVREDQRLVIRVHSQELFRNYLARIQAEKVDEIIFVSPHIRDAARSFKSIRGIKTRIVPNLVRDDFQSSALDDSTRFTIGLVGIVPQQKGLDRALDLLNRLREQDSRFTLRIKGRLPEEYAWMVNRDEEMEFYHRQYERITSNPLLKEAVHFDGYSDAWSDMVAWYRSVGVVISVSEFESFHFTLVDGPMNGALPLSLRWPGADRIYPETWLVNEVSDMANKIRSTVMQPEDWRIGVQDAQRFVRESFDPHKTLTELLECLSGEEF